MQRAWRILDEKAKQAIDQKLSQIDVTQTGFWFCLSCQNITEFNSNYNCKICGSSKIKHHLPIVD